MLRQFATKSIVGRQQQRQQRLLLLQQQQRQQLPCQQRQRTYSAAAAAAATSRQKRALDKQQLQGSDSNNNKTIPTGSSATTTTSIPPTPPPSSSSGGGGGDKLGLVMMATAVVAGGGAFAYYNDMIPFPSSGSDGGADTDDTDKKKMKQQHQQQQPSSSSTQKDINNNEDKKTVPAIGMVADDATTTSTTTTPSTSTPSSSSSSSLSTNTTPGPAEAGEVADDIDVADATAAAAVAAPVPVPVLPSSSETEKTTTTTNIMATESVTKSMILEELEKVKEQLKTESDRALTEAHTELAKLSILNLDNLDDMSKTQLKVRLVQLAKEMEDRTKWEAVRLQQFLSMKEKEVEDKYVLLIKKLRLEADSITQEQLAQQKKVLTQQAERALQEQQNNSDAFIESSLKIQEQSFLEEREAYTKQVEEAMNAKYEELYGKTLAKVKEEFGVKMNKQVQQMERLSQKLTDLETSLQSSKDFQEGSVQAHRITAAALALSEKLESGEPAGTAIQTLQAIASENPVVSSVVDALPPSVSSRGVATLQEIQTTFEDVVYPECRRAASVPSGQDGLEGQILGMVFSKLKYPPAPDDPAPESEKDAGEYVLARARRHVQLGELEEAVTELDKLKGQTAFVAKDWEDSVKARVAVEKALKVIKMECTLANESLSQAQ